MTRRRSEETKGGDVERTASRLVVLFFHLSASVLSTSPIPFVVPLRVPLRVPPAGMNEGK